MSTSPDGSMCGDYLRSRSGSKVAFGNRCYHATNQPELSLRNNEPKYLSLIHDLTGLGSTRVVRLCASARSRWDEPDDMATGTQDGKVLRCAGALRVEAFFGDWSVGVTGRKGLRGCSTAGSARRLRAGFLSMRCSGWSRNTAPAAFVERRTQRRRARAVADVIEQVAVLAKCGIHSLPRRSRGQRAGHTASSRERR